MSKYSFADSIRDGATLPLNFEPVPVELHINQDMIRPQAEAPRSTENNHLAL